MDKKAQILNQNDPLSQPAANGEGSAMSVGSPKEADNLNVQTQNFDPSSTNQNSQLNPNVQTFVSPRTPRKKEEKPVLEVTFTAFPKSGELDGVDLLDKLNEMLSAANLQSSNISIRIINKKF